MHTKSCLWVLVSIDKEFPALQEGFYAVLCAPHCVIRKRFELLIKMLSEFRVFEEGNNQV